MLAPSRRLYHNQFQQVISYINENITPHGLIIVESAPSATTLVGYDDTYTIELHNNHNMRLGTCTVVIDQFSIDDNDPSTVLFVDYTEVEARGLGLSRIFVLFEVLFAILLGAPVVSNDVSGIPGRYRNYGFVSGDFELTYEDDEDEAAINNILTVDRLQQARQVLEERINAMFTPQEYYPPVRPPRYA